MERPTHSMVGAIRDADPKLKLGSFRPVKAARMATAAGEPEEVKWERSADGALKIEISGSPVFIEGE